MAHENYLGGYITTLIIQIQTLNLINFSQMRLPTSRRATFMYDAVSVLYDLPSTYIHNSIKFNIHFLFDYSQFLWQIFVFFAQELLSLNT